MDGVQTYYSPCHAGCGEEIFINDVRMFANCSCGVDTQIPMVDLIATDGACGMGNCQPYLIFYQALSIFASAFLGSTLIGKLIITIRSVLPQDKASAIALELSLISLIVYIPGKIGYREIADQTCQYSAPDQYRCFLHENPTYGNLLNVTTAGLILIALLFEALLLMTIGNLSLYGEPDDEVLQWVFDEILIESNFIFKVWIHRQCCGDGATQKIWVTTAAWTANYSKSTNRWVFADPTNSTKHCHLCSNHSTCSTIHQCDNSQCLWRWSWL